MSEVARQRRTHRSIPSSTAVHVVLRRVAAGSVVSLALIAAPPALAQTSAQDSYSTPAGSVQQQLGGSNHVVPAKSVQSSTPSSTPSRLPFTGLDIGLVLAASGVLLALGVSLRQLSRQRT